jgi:hypothetical protein
MNKFIAILAGAALSVAAFDTSRAAETTTERLPIQRIYLVHFSHTDFGFTDLQSVCRDLQVRYLDMAIDAVLATATGPEERKFRWTAESTVAVADWWAAASPARRDDFRRALKTGQFEVAAMPFNQTPFLNARQWQTMLHWLPEDMWKECQPTVAVQNGVNGLPRAGATALLDRGIKHLFMGINADSGGPPFYRPSAFWWKMPDGRRLFVWLKHSYPAGFDFFETYEWRRGPVPRAGDMQFRPAAGTDCQGIYPEVRPPAPPEFPAAFPDSWLRVARRGNQFSAFASTDGITWKLYAEHVLILASTVKVGPALTSHNPEIEARAAFRDYTEHNQAPTQS